MELVACRPNDEPPAGGTRPSSSRASQRRRLAIEDATRSLLRVRDVAEVSVSDIADHAQVSVATVYNLVGTRDRLLAAVLEGYVHRLAAALDRQPGDAGLVDAAVAVILAAVDEALADPLPLRAVLRELGPLDLERTKASGVADLITPRLAASGASERAAAEAARLIVYAFRGALLSWAHGLINDEQFRTDAELATQRIASASFDLET